MTSLSEAYNRKAGERHSLRRLYAGTALFAAGALLLAVAILLTATDAFAAAGLGIAEARRLGGVLGGVGLPAVFLGVFAVLPSSRTMKTAAGIGAAIALLGVGLFWHAYPCQWVGATCGGNLADLTLPTVGVYFLGTMTTFWCLFVGVANFKTRNDPGGTARVDVTTRGETRVIEVPKSSGIGGLGFLGGTPDGEVGTQTAGGDPAGATADGGADAELISDVPEPDGPSTPLDPDDSYCGNCLHFQYVRTDEGIQPYCGYDERLMDDMDACEAWTPRT